MSQATLGSAPYRNSSLFSGYYLDERIDDLEDWECDSEAQDAFDQLQQLWELEGELVSGYKEDELLSSWIDEVIDILGFGTQSETTIPGGNGYNDRLLFDSENTRREAAKRGIDGETEAMYGMAAAVLEAKQWDSDFSEQFNEQRSYRDASHQIKYYLERTPERLQWGILTDGKKWRLYGTKDYATEVYYEVDLPELLEAGDLEEFKYFYAFFRPEAFREIAGTTFLDRVWNESETAAQELGEDLQDNVFTALRVLGEGFIHTNDLDIDPDDAAARDELKEQSLVLLYRLMFVLYAESRGLIHPDDPDAQDEYDEHFSLDQIRLEIHDRITSGDFYDDWSGYATQIWSQLEDLFGLVDKGEESLGIPPYNGGLFDEEQHEFLAEHEVADRYIAEVIHRLGTTEGEDGNPVIADYADLDTRHLGGIYEGLLEHEFRIASEPYAAVAEDSGQVWKPGTKVSVAEAVETVDEGELYVVNDDGERKATGAYYTPDYVVNYIVEETIDPLLDDIREDLEADGLDPSDQAYFGRFYSEVQDLKILDPAMGSAHFLTSATAYLTEQVMEIVREQERQGRDEQEIRRTIAKECIYGVDINGMAVELGKLSMWLETLAADKPLAFLDHHMKAGNSLVGSDITEVLSDDSQENGGQLTLTQAFAHARQQTLEHVMDLMEELLAIENDDLSDIKSMEELYDEIRDDRLYQRLFEIANVHTAEKFGLDVPESAYEEMAGAIEDQSKWEEIWDKDWFQSAQEMSNDEDFFHWELEFPEVFFGDDGEKLDRAGFDGVVGNPPYVKIQNIPSSIKQYYSTEYHVARERYDLYGLFVELAESITEQRTGLILPNKFFEAKAGKPLREHLIDSKSVEMIVDFEQNQIFESATTYTCLLFLSRYHNSNEISYATVNNPNKTGISEPTFVPVDLDESGDKWSMAGEDERKVLDKIESVGNSFEEITDQILVGVQTSANEVFILEDCDIGEEFVEGYSPAVDDRVRVESEITEPFVTDSEVKRYSAPETSNQLIYPYTTSGEILQESTLEERYPKTYEYLLRLKKRLSNRGSENQVFENWFAHWCPRDPKKFKREKILISQVVKQGECTYDSGNEVFFSSTVYSPILKDRYKNSEDQYALLAILNSSSIWFYIKHTGTVLRGEYYRYKTEYLEPISIPLNEAQQRLSDKVETRLRLTNERENLNVRLKDFLGSYSNGDSLEEIGFTQPPEGSAESILQETTEEKPNLQIGEASVVRESDTTVEVRLTARYKPDPTEKGREAYTETEPLPALRITDLTETEVNLIEAFVPIAVDEAGGFANFRDNATKTNSLVDRLRKLTLPAVDDVRDGLESYIETKERAEELEEKIERTDDLIDEIVYELYGLTDEEIEIVEEAVSE